MQPALFFETERVQGLPGPAVGPEVPKIAQNPGPDLSFYPPQGLPSSSGIKNKIAAALRQRRKGRSEAVPGHKAFHVAAQQDAHHDEGHKRSTTA